MTDCAAGTDSQPAGERLAAIATPLDQLGVFEQPACVGEQSRSCAVEQQAFTDTVEQFCPEHGLKLIQRSAGRRLRQGDGCGRRIVR